MIVFEQVCTVIIVIIIIIRCELDNPPGGLHTSTMFIFATFIFALQNNRSKYSVRVGGIADQTIQRRVFRISRSPLSRHAAKIPAHIY